LVLLSQVELEEPEQAINQEEIRDDQASDAAPLVPMPSVPTGRSSKPDGAEASTDQAECQPRSKVAFAKTHKTGSSTLQNIFFRYGISNGINFAMPPKSWMFSYKVRFRIRREQYSKR